MSGQAAEIAVGAKTVDRAINDRGIDLFDRRVVDAESRRNAWAEGLNHNAGVLDQIEGNLAIVRLCHVQGDAALVAIHRRKIDTGFLVVRWIEPPIIADARLLDLDDIGTEVAQNLGTPGPWQKTGKIDDTHAVQRKM